MYSNNIIIPENVFTDNSLNIFTDASIRKLKSGETVACAGALTIFGSMRGKRENYQIIRNTTNNNAEIKAIRLGLDQAVLLRNQYDTIRIFSDSQISVFGVRERIFKWKQKGGVFCGTEGTPIKNQDIMLEIVNIITEYDMTIEFYHQSGHVTYDKESLLDAIHVFCTSNNIRSSVSYDFIRTISQFNNYVDQKSREKLKSIDERILIANDDLFANSIFFTFNNFDKSKYSECLQNTIV